MPASNRRRHRVSGPRLKQGYAGNLSRGRAADRQGPRPISQYSWVDLFFWKINMRNAGLTHINGFSFSEICCELYHHDSCGLDGEFIVACILRLCAASPNGLTNYRALYCEVWQTKKFAGHNIMHKINAALTAANLHCIHNQIPMVTTLVNRDTYRQLSANAADTIHDCCKHFGVADVGENADAFVRTMQDAALAYVKTHRAADAA